MNHLVWVSRKALMIEPNRSEVHLPEEEEVEGQEIPVAKSSQELLIAPRVPRLAKGQREQIDQREAKGRNAVQGQNGPIVRSVRNGPTGQSVPISQREPIDQNGLKEQIAQIVRRAPSDLKELAGQNEQIGRTEPVGQSVPKVQTAPVDQKELRTAVEAHEMIAADAIATFANPVLVTNVETHQHIPNRFLNQPDSVQDCTMTMISDFAMNRFFWNKMNSCWLTMTTRMHLARR
jgi:hypothetical protein